MLDGSPLSDGTVHWTPILPSVKIVTMLVRLQDQHLAFWHATKSATIPQVI